MKQKSASASIKEKNLEGPSSMGTVSRVLKLLSVLADSTSSITVKDVVEQTQLPPSTVHRLLNLLIKDGFAEGALEDRSYAIGPQFYRVAARVVDRVAPPQVAKKTLENIAARYNETVLYGMYLPTEQAVSFESRADGKQRLQYQIDKHKPLSLIWGASGKCILAFLAKETVREALSAEVTSSATGEPPPCIEKLEQELALIREQGYAVSEGEKLHDARGIAAPVFGPRGVIGCICLTSPKSRTLDDSIEAIGLAISAYARTLSQELGA